MTFIDSIIPAIPFPIHARFKNITNQTFQRLTAINYQGQNKFKQAQWLFRCQCGTLRILPAYNVTTGNTTSCGCKRKEGRPPTHQHSYTSTYYRWSGIIQRCTNPNNKEFHNYGGRGITVCSQWLKFENFLADMGEAPIKMSIDRIDNNKGYSPKNCRWATPKEQMNNIRKNVTLAHQGKTQSVSMWAREVHIHVQTLWKRIRMNWSVNDILTTIPDYNNKNLRRADVQRTEPR